MALQQERTGNQRDRICLTIGLDNPIIHTNNLEEDQTYKPLFRERAMGAR
jgi:hypothetical protein